RFQLLIFRDQSLGGLAARRMVQAAKLPFDRIAVTGADPTGEHPASRRDGDNRNNEIGSKSHSAPPLLLLAQLLDFLGETAVFGRDIAFDVGQAPVDVAHAAADLSRALRR